MAYTSTKIFDNNPNTGNVLDIQTSYQSDLFDSVSAHAGGEMGVGSFKKRSIDSLMVKYEPYRTAINTMIMLTGGRDTGTNVVHEWGEDDDVIPFEGVGAATPTNANTVINNVSGGAPYVPATSGIFEVPTGVGLIFYPNSFVRYSIAGGWQFAYVDAVSIDSLTLKSTDGINLAIADSNTASIQTLSSGYGSDLDHSFNPRSNNPSMYYTYLQKLEASGKYTKRAGNEENYLIDQITRAQNKAFQDMNFQLERLSLYGKRSKISITNENGDTDWVYSTPGLWDSAKENNYHTSDFKTATVFDATKFKDALYKFIDLNFGAESGGAPLRQGFIDGQFASYLSRAFEDKQRFTGSDFVGGVKVDRFDVNNGAIDFMRAPIFEMVHPTKQGSLRQSGEALGVCLLVPIRESVVRVEMQGEGLRDDTFPRKNGGEEWLYRVAYTTGMAHKLRQYSAVLEEVPE